ncbi:septum formation family protein [Tomitella gaofuii]|uniref:septum formation family protein n=1 Tax=Tomitella gaofuii TaxID=2760083 RepID=UPI0015F97670|nr:septum formation family protein [Tomitella gaofuii]
MHSKASTRAGITAGAVAAAVVLLSACGSGGTDPGDGGTASGGSEGESAIADGGDGNGGSGSNSAGTHINPLFAQVGDCFSEFPAMDGTAILSIELRDCGEPHAGEVVDSFEIDDTRVGLEQVQSSAADDCARRVPQAVDTERVDTRAQIFYWAPDAVSWNNGNRTVLCGLGVPAGKTTGSVGLHGA